ncbi:hypothetical protein PUN28_004546 [Cardiocondyla obscurior]|uniref:Uncharacterized protein n=1 Tax=Cardiocondyla obscurior TaxID=286306 RepID=A0AAW2GD79_9HYME
MFPLASIQFMHEPSVNRGWQRARNIVHCPLSHSYFPLDSSSRIEHAVSRKRRRVGFRGQSARTQAYYTSTRIAEKRERERERERERANRARYLVDACDQVIQETLPLLLRRSPFSLSLSFSLARPLSSSLYPLSPAGSRPPLRLTPSPKFPFVSLACDFGRRRHPVVSGIFYGGCAAASAGSFFFFSSLSLPLFSFSHSLSISYGA